MTARVLLDFASDHPLETGGVLSDIVQHACRVCVLMKGGVGRARRLRKLFCDSRNLAQVLGQRLPVSFGVEFVQAAGVGVSPKGAAYGMRGCGDAA
jgi:hypothetical protein